jgi:hypothetical protein
MTIHHQGHKHPGFVNTAFIQQVPKQTAGAGKQRKRRVSHQAGGFPLAPLIAIGSALKAMKPFTHGKALLEKVISEKGKNSLGYKIAHGIGSVGESLGLGHQKPRRRKRTTR